MEEIGNFWNNVSESILDRNSIKNQIHNFSENAGEFLSRYSIFFF
jgi:hypothetical protein